MSASRRMPMLGIALSSDAVRALSLAQGRVTWTHKRQRDPESTLEETLRAVLAQVPRPRWGRMRVAIAVGPSHAQLRVLHHLPVVRSERMLEAIVQQNAGRYFLQNGIPVLTTPLARTADDTRWGGAIEEPVVRALSDACAREGFSIAHISPVAAILGRAVPNGRFTWIDGDVALHLHYENAKLRECRRVPTTVALAADDASPGLDGALSALGADAFRFADAFAAASVATPAVALTRARIDGNEPSVLRLAIAGAACLVTLAFAAMSPLISAARQEHAATTQLKAFAARGEHARIAERKVVDSLRMIGELAAFRRESPSTTLLLASLTDAIEPPTMVVSLRLDQSGGVLTALTPSTAALLAMLARVPEISSPVISGSLTPESPAAQLGPPASPFAPLASTPAVASTSGASSRPQERVAIRFHWKGERAAPRTALGVR